MDWGDARRAEGSDSFQLFFRDSLTGDDTLDRHGMILTHDPTSALSEWEEQFNPISALLLHLHKNSPTMNRRAGYCFADA